jgi:SAM-dependent methyltransferase
MFDKSADVYDRIYLSFKNYDNETSILLSTIRQCLGRSPGTILEAACGTGLYIKQLQSAHDVVGFDIDYNMVRVARSKGLAARLFVADMRTFGLRLQFEVVLCLFSAIAYARTVEQMSLAVANMADHVKPGGCLVIEPWISKEEYLRRPLHAVQKPVFVNDVDMKIARMIDTDMQGRCSVMTFHYLVANDTGVRYFYEKHVMGLFTDAEYRAAFEQAGLRVMLSDKWPNGRGLYIGVRDS